MLGVCVCLGGVAPIQECAKLGCHAYRMSWPSAAQEPANTVVMAVRERGEAARIKPQLVSSGRTESDMGEGWAPKAGGNLRHAVGQAVWTKVARREGSP